MSTRGLLDLIIAAPPPPFLAPHVSPPLTPAQGHGVDLVLQGFLLHHGVARTPGDDLGGRVLAGDYCYADGLVRVAEAGDLFVVALLADLIALSSALVAARRRDALPALWAVTVAAIADRDPGLRARAADAVRALRQDRDPAPVMALGAGMDTTTALAEVLGQ